MSILNSKLIKMLWFSLPSNLRNYFISKLRYPGYIPPGWASFGDLRRTNPIGKNYGLERGMPIDRYYIERFMAAHSSDIKGTILEIGDNRYTTKYGKEKVTKGEILNLSKEGFPQTTIVADLSSAPHIPSNTFDCIIFTQTLQYIYDVRAAISTLYRILKPGGKLLASVPSISQKTGEGREYWCWSFTSLSANRLFKESFPAENMEIRNYGNVLVAISFLHGLALQELNEEELNYYDEDYECLITVKACKPE